MEVSTSGDSVCSIYCYYTEKETEHTHIIFRWQDHTVFQWFWLKPSSCDPPHTGSCTCLISCLYDGFSHRLSFCSCSSIQTKHVKERTAARIKPGGSQRTVSSRGILFRLFLCWSKHNLKCFINRDFTTREGALVYTCSNNTDVKTSRFRIETPEGCLKHVDKQYH